MNASYNKSFEQASSVANQGSRTRSFSLLVLLATLFAVAVSVVKTKVFRAVTVTVCFFIALGAVGGVETGALSFGAAFAILAIVAVIEWLCFRKS